MKRANRNGRKVYIKMPPTVGQPDQRPEWIPVDAVLLTPADPSWPAGCDPATHRAWLWIDVDGDGRHHTWRWPHPLLTEIKDLRRKINCLLDGHAEWNVRLRKMEADALALGLKLPGGWQQKPRAVRDELYVRRATWRRGRGSK